MPAAVLAGTGAALLTPAAPAGGTRLAPGDRRPAALGLFGALDDVGLTAGPALAAGLLAVLPGQALLGANAISFAVSALLPTGLAPRSRSGEQIVHRSLRTDLRVGLRGDGAVIARRALPAVVPVAARVRRGADLHGGRPRLCALSPGLRLLLPVFVLGGLGAGCTTGCCSATRCRRLHGRVYALQTTFAVAAAGMLGVIAMSAPRMRAPGRRPPPHPPRHDRVDRP